MIHGKDECMSQMQSESRRLERLAREEVLDVRHGACGVHQGSAGEDRKTRLRGVEHSLDTGHDTRHIG